MARVALYARVSGHAQEKEETVETQRYYLEQWAREKGHEVVGWYADTNVRSAVPIADRPEGGRLLRDAARGIFDTVAIYRLSRWSRYTQVWHEGKTRLDALHIELHCLNEDIRDETPGDRFTLGVKLLVNELDRDTIAANCLDGRYRRAHEGGYTGGIVPYGYRVTGGRRRILEPDAGEAEIVRRIYHWLVDERLSCVQIARRLNTLGVPTACQSQDEERHRKHQTDVRGLWSNSRVSRVVRNPIYSGEKEFGVSNNGRRDRVLQRVAPIVERDLWDRAQERLGENLIAARRNRKYDYALSGLVICTHCQRRCYGKTLNQHKKHKASYYICNRRTLKHQGYDPDIPPCPLPYIRADELEASVWSALWPRLKDSRKTILLLRERAGDGLEGANTLRETADALRAALERKGAARRRAIDMATEGLITRDDLADQLSRLRAEADDLEAQIEALEADIQQIGQQDCLMERAAEWLEGWEAKLSGEISVELRRAAIRAMTVAIELSVVDGCVQPHYRFAFDPRPRSSMSNVTAYAPQLLVLAVQAGALRRIA